MGKVEWIQTDDDQLVRKIDEFNFQILNGVCVCLNPKKIFVYKMTVDIQDYLADAKQYIDGYGYESVDALKELYGDDWQQVLAECIVESICSTDGDIFFEGTEHEMDTWLEKVKKEGLEV